MINRLKEFIAQTKGISTSKWIYFENGISYTYDNEQLVQAFTNFKEDKKGGNFFNDKTFKIQVDEFSDFIKDRKKDIININFEGNTIKILTKIPNISLEFKWEKTDDLKLEKIKKFFKELNINEDEKVFDYSFNEDELNKFIKDKPNRIFANITDNCISFNEDNLKDSFLMISIFPKYLGKLLSSTKEFNLKIYNTENDSIYLIHYTIKNMSIVSEYFGLCSDLILLEEGGLN